MEGQEVPEGHRVVSDATASFCLDCRLWLSEPPAAHEGHEIVLRTWTLLPGGKHAVIA